MRAEIAPLESRGARAARDHQPDGHLPGPELLEARPAPRRGLVGQLPELARRGNHPRWRQRCVGSRGQGLATRFGHRLRARPEPQPQGRPPVPVDGEHAERHELALGGAPEAPRHAPAVVPAGRGPRLGLGAVLPVAQEPGQLGEAARRRGRPLREGRHPGVRRRGGGRPGAGEAGRRGGNLRRREGRRAVRLGERLGDPGLAGTAERRAQGLRAHLQGPLPRALEARHRGGRDRRGPAAGGLPAGGGPDAVPGEAGARRSGWNGS